VLLQPLVIARQLDIPAYVIFDANADKPDKNGSQDEQEGDNRALLKLLGKPRGNPMPTEICSGPGFTMWYSDIGKILNADIGSKERLWHTNKGLTRAAGMSTGAEALAAHQCQPRLRLERLEILGQSHKGLCRIIGFE